MSNPTMDDGVEEPSSPPQDVSLIDAPPNKTTTFVTLENEGDFPLPSVLSWLQSGLSVSSAPVQALREPVLVPIEGSTPEGDDGR